MDFVIGSHFFFYVSNQILTVIASVSFKLLETLCENMRREDQESLWVVSCLFFKTSLTLFRWLLFITGHPLMKTRHFWQLLILLSDCLLTPPDQFWVGKDLNIELHFQFWNPLVQVSTLQIWTKWLENFWDQFTFLIWPLTQFWITSRLEHKYDIGSIRWLCRLLMITSELCLTSFVHDI